MDLIFNCETGEGSSGCYTLYHLTKRGIKTLLLDRFKLTTGTTWHTWLDYFGV